MTKTTKIFAAFFIYVFFMLLPAAQAETEAPVFGYESGVYQDVIYVTLSGSGDIYYTLDGSLPTLYSTKYDSPIAVLPETSTISQGTEQIEVPKATVIRAAVISGDDISPVVSKTYFVASGGMEFMGRLPMMNLIVTPYDLWDGQNGIYQNVYYEHKVPAEIQCIDAAGDLAFSLNDIETKISGHGSRGEPKKSFRIYMAKGNPLRYCLIPKAKKNVTEQSPVMEYKTFNLRITDWTNTNLRDVMAQSLAENTRLDTAQSTPAALFLNGEYWGLYECREHYNDNYLEAHYGIDNDDIVFLSRDWTLELQNDVLSDTGRVYQDRIEYSEGPKDGSGMLGESYYRDQWRYVQSLIVERDITDPNVYREFAANVDIDNFIDYLIVYIYSANDDWPGNNFKFWRVAEEKVTPGVYGADGKWRFMVHDFDIAFENIYHNTLELSTFYKGSTNMSDEFRHPEFASKLLGNLLKNEDFRNEFAQRTMAYTSTFMSREAVSDIAERLSEERINGKYADLMRWNLGQSNNRLSWWQKRVSSFVSFAGGRGNILTKQYTSILNDRYNAGIDGTSHIVIQSPMTDVEVNGAILKAGKTYNLEMFSGLPVVIDAGRAMITVKNGDEITDKCGEMTFVPKNGAQYNVFIKLENSATSYEENIRKEYFIARSGRFGQMSAGETLPVVVFDESGNRVSAEITVEGDAASYKDGMITAKEHGAGVIRAVIGGDVVSAEVMVK